MKTPNFYFVFHFQHEKLTIVSETDLFTFMKFFDENAHELVPAFTQSD